MNGDIKTAISELDENVQEQCAQIRKINALLSQAWSSEASSVCMERARKISLAISQISDEIINISVTGDPKWK